MVWCAFKHKEHFSYRPQYTVWLSSNHTVNGDPDDNALWGRVKVVEFPHSYYGKEDKTLKERLKSPEQLEGVLKWIVDGAANSYKQGLHTPEAVTKSTQAQRDQLDTVGLWLEECCDTTNKNAKAPSTEVRKSYVQWCDENGHEAKKAKAFNDSLRLKGLEPNTSERHGAHVQKVVKGLRLEPTLLTQECNIF